jgi:PAS domain S-box-containing protein
MESDIPASTDATESWRQLDQKYRSMFENCVVGIFQTSPEGKYLSANPALARIYGYQTTTDLVVALTDLNKQLYVQPGRRAEFIRQIQEEGQVIDFESQVYRRDRTVIWIVESARVVRDELSNEILYFEGMVQDITRRKLAEEERDLANARLALQYAVTRTLAEMRHLGEASSKVVQAICETMQWDVGALWYVDPSEEKLICADVWKDPNSPATAFVAKSREMTFQPGLGLPGRVWTSRKAFWIPDIVIDPNFPRAESAAGSGLHSAFAFPVSLDGKVIAVMEFFSRGIHSPDDDLLATLTALGTQMAKFMERENLADQLRRITESSGIGS